MQLDIDVCTYNIIKSVLSVWQKAAGLLKKNEFLWNIWFFCYLSYQSRMILS